jgi:NAD(P) transhydrogenase
MVMSSLEEPISLRSHEARYQEIRESSTEVVHIGHMAMLCHAKVDIFIESTFNFPTLAEAYRIAAIEIIAKRPKE